MTIQENISLKNYNTFGIDVNARHFVEVTSEKDLEEILLSKKNHRKFILGGGSNILLTTTIDHLVIYLNIKGKEVIFENENSVVIKVFAGENWHNFVLWSLERDYGGIENLSLIPGNVGTAPIQNIGAYGVELKDVFVSCEAIHTKTLKKHTFSLSECKFGYRDSIFKREAKGNFVITAVNFKLSKKKHQLNTSYGAIEEFLKKNNILKPTIKNISQAVIAIRKSKLPDPSEIGNSGSFFKNPIIKKTAFEELLKKHLSVPHYVLNDHEVKIPAGWLIEQCGFKGKRFGDAGVHKKQALVLVNYGNASGMEILALAKKIQNNIKEVFNISIETEVNII